MISSLPQAQLDWLMAQGLPIDVMLWPTALLYGDGSIYFDDDDVLWNPETGYLSGGFCLGSDNISDASAYSFDGALRLWETPLEWLKANRTGIVVIDWTQAFDRLRDCPRLAVPKGLMGKYKQWMKVPRMPEIRLA